MEEKRAVYIEVNEKEARPEEGRPGTVKRDLLRSEYLEIAQIWIAGPGAIQAYGAESKDRLYYVLDGEATLGQEAEKREVKCGSLIVVPRGTSWGCGFFVRSDNLTLLRVIPRVEPPGGSVCSDAPQAASLRVVSPDRVPAYEPAGHRKTLNRCLFENEQVEIIEGNIEAGGGAEEHLHEEHEQVLYVLEGSETPVLIYYPRGTPHGTSGGVSQPLKLLVIYSPPLGEAAGKG